MNAHARHLARKRGDSKKKRKARNALRHKVKTAPFPYWAGLQRKLRQVRAR